MRLTWRDALSTLLVAAGAAVVVPLVGGWDWAPVGSYRLGVVALAVLGQGMCLLGRELKPGMKATPYVVLSCALGGAALVLVVAGLVTASRTVLIGLSVTVGALWLLATTRHALGLPPRPAVPV
jgi:hypothetical protein